MDNLFVVSAPPHIHSPLTARRAMVIVCLALLPSLIMGTIYFGMYTLLVIIITVISCVLFEIACECARNRKARTNDLTAVLTGLLLAASLPPGVPLWMPIAGAGFSIIIVKQFFGGMGFNILNPALTGRAFLTLCFPIFMINSWTKPFSGSLSGIDVITQATPLTILKNTGYYGGGEMLTNSFGSPAFLRTLFLGQFGGSIGETCKLTIVIGGIFLLIIGIIDYRIITGYLMAFIVTNIVLPNRINPLFQLLTGGVLLAIFFMATDWVTTPLTKNGRWIFGIGCGFFTSIFRAFTPFPEGVTPAILLMNALTPFIDKMTSRRSSI